MGTNTDRIEKKVLLRAPLERVWRAISDSKQFGSWFGVQLDGPFVAGRDTTAKIVPTSVDAEVARMQKPLEGMTFTIFVERVEPMRHLSFRWHPGVVEPGVDYAKEPMTLVAFELEQASDGTMLTITESGFDRISLERRAKAFAENEQGWEEQTRLIAKYLDLAA
jgi:uncharacterized protein YndB with AHSA1/START domain